MTTLGDIVSEFEPTEDDLTRLADDFRNDGPARQVFESHIRQTESFQNCYKSIRAPGQSPGRPEQKNVAIKRLVSVIKNREGSLYKYALRLYHATVVKHLESHHPELQELLTNVKTNDAEMSKTAILAEICRYSAVYEVETASIVRLYNIWYFDRLAENIETFIESHSELDDEIKSELEKREQNEFQAVFKSEIEILKKQIVEVTNKLDKIETAAQDDLSSSFDDRIAKAIEELEIRISSESDAKNKTIREVEDALSDSKKSVFEQLKQVQRTQNSLTENIDRIERKFENSKVKIIAEIESSVSLASKALQASIDAQSDRISSTNQKIRDIEIATSPRSIFSKKPKVQTNKTSIKTEVDFLALLKKKFESTYGEILSDEITTVYHNIMKCSAVPIFSDHRFPLLWLESLGFSNTLLEQVVSPTWASENDWVEEQRFLFSETDSDARFLVLHDFDNAIVSCYFSPTLKRWSISNRYKNAKIICLKNEHNSLPIDKPILDFSTFIPIDDFSRQRNVLIKEQIKVNQKNLESTEGVSQKTFREWIKPAKDTEEIAAKVKIVEKSLKDVKIPKMFIPRIAQLSANLETQFEGDYPIIISFYHIVGPWLSSEYGLAVVDEMTTILSVNYSSAVNY